MPTTSDTGLSFDALFLLWAARRTGIVDALTTTAGTPEAVAAETGVTARAARVTVEALADLGFLARVGDEYEITNRALGLLATRDVRSIGALPHALDLMDLLVDLPETMRSGEAPTKSDRWTRHRLGARAAADETMVRARVTEAVRHAPRGGSVLVLTDGAGAHAREFAARGFDVTAVADAAVAEVLDPLLSPADVRLEAADASTLAAAGRRFDLVFGVDSCGDSDPSAAGDRIGDAAALVRPDGALVVADVVAAGSDDAVAIAVRRLATGAGGAYDDAEYRDWFAPHFEDVRVAVVPGTTRQAVIGRRPVERAVEGR
ncbi:SAM-dependent methyltransferase [Haloferacaceae archaeon DSL9]